MSKKHFIKLAATLATHREAMSVNAFNSLCSDIASICAQTNPNFDRNRFIDACSVDVKSAIATLNKR